jgi:rod shape-determining protein MreD
VILTRQIYLRLALILLAGVVLQVAFFSEISILGGTPDALPVLIACLGLLGGAVVGAVCGFAAGLLMDSALLQTLGVSSLVLLAVGYLAGRYREGFEITRRFVPPTICGALTLFASFLYGVIQVTLGVDSPVSPLVVREVVLQALLGFVIAIPLYPGVRWALRPALIDAGPRRRSRLRTLLTAA